jgi:methylated-DNA-[protein]-cysteine S-methyltransferase
MPHALIATPLGPLGIHWNATSLIQVDLEPVTDTPARLVDSGRSEARAPDDASAERIGPAIMRQLMEYFAHGATAFDLPLALAGTAFQQRVWSLLRTIPAGETRTYGEISRLLGSAARAVGQACRANPCPIVVPCHRVVSARGLGGFAGATSGRQLAVKRWLLRHEGVTHV